MLFLCICSRSNSFARAASATTIDAVRNAVVGDDPVANKDDGDDSALEIVDPQKHEWRGGDAVSVDASGVHSSQSNQQQKSLSSEDTDTLSSPTPKQQKRQQQQQQQREQENSWIVKTPQDAAVESNSLLASKQQLVQDTATSSSSVLLFASLAVVVAFGLGCILGYVIATYTRRVMATTRRAATVHSNASSANKKSSAENSGQHQRNTPTLGYALMTAYESDTNRRNNGRTDSRYNRQFDDREGGAANNARLYNSSHHPAMQHRETSAAMATLDAYSDAVSQHNGNEDFDDDDVLDLLVVNPAATASRKQRLD